MEHDFMGVHVARSGELAPANLALPRPRLPALSPQSGRPSLHQPVVARYERAAVVPDSRVVYRIHRSQPDGGRTLCRASPESGVRRLGGGTQERALHVFLSTGVRCLWMVRPEAGDRALSGGRDSVCHGPYVQADGHYSAFRPSATGLLATGKIRV